MFVEQKLWETQRFNAEGQKAANSMMSAISNCITCGVHV